MKTFLTVLLLLLPALAQAAPIIRVRTEAEPATKVALEVSATAPENQAEAEATAEWAKKELQAAIDQNPGIKPEIIVATGGENGGQVEALAAKIAAGTDAKVVKEALPQDVVSSLKSKFKGWFDRHYRVTFTLVRGVANSGVTTWGLVLSADIPLSSALPVGLIAGSMSAGFQYHNEWYAEWMLRAKSTLGRYTRNYGAQVAYMTLVKLTSALTGIPGEARFVDSIQSVLMTSLYCTLAQGPWSIAIAENARIEMEKHPEKTRRIRYFRDLKTLAVSMVTTAISVASLLRVPLADAAMVGVGAFGGVYYVKTLIKGRKWKSEKDKALACELALKAS